MIRKASPAAEIQKRTRQVPAFHEIDTAVDEARDGVSSIQ